MSAHSVTLHVQVDPLIGEARQRARRRRLLLAALLVGAVTLAAVVSLAFRQTGGGLETFRSSSGRWIPAGVAEVDLHSPNPTAPPISLRVTDPSQVKQIVGWFNGLASHRHGGACLGGYAATVSITFRSATGAALAAAHSSPLPAGYCDPISFRAGAKPGALLYDPNGARDPNGTTSFITRVRDILGLSRMFEVYRG